jgi:phosphatidate cytidylyltransferase
MGAAVLISLFTYRPLFVALVAVSVAYGCYELASVMRTAADRYVPLPPLVVGTGVTYTIAYQRGSQALAVGVLLTAIALIAWRLADRVVDAERRTDVARDLAAALWVLCYLVLLAGFAILLAAPSDGARRAACFVATVVCSDVGGFAAGVLFGKHPLAPAVSPKKSWEGLGGSVFACLAGAGILLTTLLHTQWWQALVFGFAMALLATAGDLAESLVKRDLGVKDMGRLLPGHGGLMDRLDSMLLTAPVAYLLLTAFTS